MSNVTPDNTAQNPAAPYDTGLYDPEIHDNQIVTMYETDAQADQARQTLEAAGFPAAAVEILKHDPAAATAHTAETSGFWGAIKSLFVPDEDRSTYHAAVSRGHAMLVVTPDATMDRHHLIHVLESTGPLDFDAKLEEWRQAGYDSSSAMTSATTGSAMPVGAGNTDPGPVDTGYKSAPAPDTWRAGQRDGAGSPRVRSYFSERSPAQQATLDADRAQHDFSTPPEHGIAARAAAPEPAPAPAPGPDSVDAGGTLPSQVGPNPNATPGAGSSGTNSPRK